MNWSQFRAIPNGTRIFNHGFDECVAVANLYHESVIGGAFVPVQSAYQWWTGGWEEVARLYTRSSRPVAGALVIWDRRWGAGHGHIGVVTGVLPDGRFTTIEQNAGHGHYRYVNRYSRGMTGVLGFLIPRNNPAHTPKQSKTEKRPEFISAEEEYLMANKIVYITDSIKSNPYYRYNPIAGTKRKISRREWETIRKIEAEKGLEVALVQISTAQLNAISNG